MAQKIMHEIVFKITQYLGQDYSPLSTKLWHIAVVYLTKWKKKKHNYTRKQEQYEQQIKHIS